MNGRGKLEALTGVRFFAAFLVVCYHVGVGPLTRISRSAGEIALKGHAAVGLFYVLSGFVLAYNYFGRRFTLRSFWVARFARIYPVYALALLLAFPAWLLHVRATHDPHSLAISMATAPFLIQAWFPPVALLWNAPAWSLSVEAFFYFAFPFLLPRLATASSRRLCATAVGFVVLTISLSAAYLLGQHQSWQVLMQRSAIEWTNREQNTMLGVILFNPVFRLPEFAAGMTLGLLFVKQSRKSSPRSVAPWVSDVIAGAAMAAAIGLSAVAQNFVPFPVIDNVLLLPVWCVLVYSLASARLWQRVLGCAPLVLLGEISYGVYILQQPISQWFKLFLLRVGHIPLKGDYPTLTLLLAYTAVLTLASYISWRWLETPLREKIRHLSRTPDRSPAGAERLPAPELLFPAPFPLPGEQPELS